MTSEHAAIHDGRAYTAYSIDEAQGAAAEMDVQIIVPADVEFHLKGIRIYSDASELEITFTEKPTITVGTNALVSVNRNRILKPASPILIYDDPTGISAGTELLHTFMGPGDKKLAATDSDDAEWIMEGLASWVLTLKNNDVGNAIVDLRIFYYLIYGD